MLQEILRKYGEPYAENMAFDLGLESAERVADFYNNGGFEISFDGIHRGFTYAAIVDGSVEVGAWVWMDGEDFDEDADFLVYDEEELTGIMLKKMVNKILEIYGKKD